jgi:MORN repeat variant
MIRFLSVFLIIFSIFSCETKQKNPKSTKKSDTTDGVKKYYDKDGKLKTELTILNGKRNGLSKTYYKNGKVSLAMNYKMGLRDGLSKRFYEEGTLYQETDYKNDKIDGVRKKYKESGKLMSEAKFENDFPCIGLQEILANGKLKDDFPSIVITPVDRLKTEGTYTINLSLSNKSRRVKFYIGNLSLSGCLSDKLVSVRTDPQTGIGKVPYTLPPGGFMMDELNFVAEVETLSGNCYITQKKFFVSIEN